MKKKIITPLLLILSIVVFNMCLVKAQTVFNPFDWKLNDHGYYFGDYYNGCYSPFGNTQPKSAVLLSTGDLVVAGAQTFDNNHSDPIPCYTRIAVSKYNTSGQITANYFSANTAPGSKRNVLQIVSTANDDIYVLGTNQYGNVIIKLNSALIEQWKFTIPQKSEIFIDADDGGNLIMAYTKVDTGSVSGKVIAIRKYSEVDGSVIYTKWLKDRKDANIGSLTGLKLDSISNIYLCGSVYSTAWGSRYLIAKFNNKGNYEWSKYYDGQAFATNDVANALVIDHNQNIIVTGESFKNATNLDVATIKYDSNGTVQWTKRSDNDSIDNTGYLIKVDDNDNVYVTGYIGNDWYEPKSFFLKYNSNGNQIKKRNFPNTKIYSLAVSSQGTCYIGASKICNYLICPDVPFAELALLTKINALGAIEWTYNSQASSTQTGYEAFFNSILINEATNEAWFSGAELQNYQLDWNYSWMIAHISPALRMAGNIESINELRINPNPATDHLQILFNYEIEQAQLTIIDLQGREVMNKIITENDETIDVTELKPGVYVTRIVYDDKAYNKKFVKE